MLSSGDKAPSFNLPDQSGRKVSLTGHKGHRVLLYFYPKADTPGCTQQACALNDILRKVGYTAIIGMSPDTPAKQLKFSEKYQLKFPLLADEDHSVAEAYGVWQEKKLYGKAYMGIVRSAFLIGPTGRIEHAWYKISPKDTPARLLEALGK